MSKIKIKISKVSNLTDARYFAAMGADYLGFCCNVGAELYCAPSKIKEITEWVVGPDYVLEMDGWQSAEEINEIVTTGLGQALHFGAFATYNSTFSCPVFKDFILENLANASMEDVDFPVIRTEKNFESLSPAEISVIQGIINEKPVFLDIAFGHSELLPMMEILPAYGLILRGGEEEKIGLKSYEQLDVIFETIEKYS